MDAIVNGDDGLTNALRMAAREWRMLIDGGWHQAVAGGGIDIMNPSTGQVVAQVPAGRAEDVELAVRAARAAFDSERWMGLGAPERARRMLKVAELIEAHAASLQALDILNIGVTAQVAQVFTQLAAEHFRYYAGWCGRATGSTMDISTPGAEFHAYTLKEPAGVAALIVPWNGPMASAAMKLATALAAGCACIVKPPEEAPLSTLLLGELLVEAGIPDGVVNIVSGLGHEAGAALAAHADVDKISFTGSTEIGKIVLRAASGNLKKVSLELGGKSPVLICDDADLDRAVPGAALGTFFNTGQVCVAGSRIYVQRGIYDRVVEGIAQVGRSLRIGGGFDPAAQIGPLISARQLNRVSGMIDTARQDGAQVIGGARHGDGGYFIEPAVVLNASAEAAILREEVFGPVIAAIPFDSMEEAVALANDSRYGLAAAIWTRDINRAHRFAKQVRAGTVWINCQLILNAAMPFGGYKQSGWGREHGPDGMDAFMQTKSVIASLG